MLYLAKATFSKRKWQLPLFLQEYEDNNYEHAFFFAKNMLEGNVFDFFKATKKLYNYPLNNMKLGSITPYVTKLVKRCVGFTKRSLLDKKWESEPSYLLEEFLQWIQPEFHEAVEKKWPPKE